MYCRRHKFIKLNILLFIVVLGLISYSCEPSPDITFQNQRNEDLKLFITHVQDNGNISGFLERGTIPANTTKIFNITFFGEEWVNRLEIRDTEGKVIFSQDYIIADLKKNGWKIVIPP
jgi:hypothetical protein